MNLFYNLSNDIIKHMFGYLPLSSFVIFTKICKSITIYKNNDTLINIIKNNGLDIPLIFGRGIVRDFKRNTSKYAGILSVEYRFQYYYENGNYLDRSDETSEANEMDNIEVANVDNVDNDNNITFFGSKCDIIFRDSDGNADNDADNSEYCDVAEILTQWITTHDIVRKIIKRGDIIFDEKLAYSYLNDGVYIYDGKKCYSECLIHDEGTSPYDLKVITEFPINYWENVYTLTNIVIAGSINKNEATKNIKKIGDFYGTIFHYNETTYCILHDRTFEEFIYYINIWDAYENNSDHQQHYHNNELIKQYLDSNVISRDNILYTSKIRFEEEYVKLCGAPINNPPKDDQLQMINEIALKIIESNNKTRHFYGQCPSRIAQL